MAIAKSNRNVDEYLAGLPDEVRSDMQTLDALIGQVFGDEERSVHEGTLWGGSEQTIIGYKTILMKGKTRTVEWPVVALALQKNYISLYIAAVEDGKYLAETYGKELGKVKVGKSSISFVSLSDIDIAKLKKLLERVKSLPLPQA